MFPLRYLSINSETEIIILKALHGNRVIVLVLIDAANYDVTVRFPPWRLLCKLICISAVGEDWVFSEYLGKYI